MLLLDRVDLSSNIHTSSKAPLHLSFDHQSISSILLSLFSNSFLQARSLIVDRLLLLLQLRDLPVPPCLFLIPLLLFLSPHLVDLFTSLLVLLDQVLSPLFFFFKFLQSILHLLQLHFRDLLFHHCIEYFLSLSVRVHSKISWIRMWVLKRLRLHSGVHVSVSSITSSLLSSRCWLLGVARHRFKHCISSLSSSRYWNVIILRDKRKCLVIVLNLFDIVSHWGVVSMNIRLLIANRLIDASLLVSSSWHRIRRSFSSIRSSVLTPRSSIHWLGHHLLILSLCH